MHIHTIGRRLVAAGSLLLLIVGGCAAGPVGPQRTLMLTWTDDPTTTMTVQWLASRRDAPAGAPVERTMTQVRYARVNANQWQIAEGHFHAFGRSDYLVQRVQLTGLTPGTTYQLIANNATPAVRFRTAPATLNEPITFAEGGDIGTGDDVAPLHEQAASWGPLFALVGGDLAYANGRDVHDWVTFLKTWRQHMITDDNRLIPMLACIGNHEVDGGFNETRAEAPYFYAMFEPLYPKRGYATLDFGDYLSFVLLDSGHTTPIAGAQTDWLRRTLRRYADNRPAHLFAAYHVPAYPGHRSWTSRGRPPIREHWVPLFDRFQVDAVFEHDDHTLKRTHPLRGGEPADHGIVYFGDGAWGQGPRHPYNAAEERHLAKTAERLHVWRVTLSKDERTFTAIDPNGKVIDRYTSRR